jgi:hypothetical protein
MIVIYIIEEGCDPARYFIFSEYCMKVFAGIPIAYQMAWRSAGPGNAKASENIEA